MKEDEVPQDNGSLSTSNMKELVYAIDKNGNYTTRLSTGWEPKTIALKNSLEEINERIAIAKQEIKEGNASPILYFMELNKMELNVLASYVEMWQWRVKRHLKASVFLRLNNKILQKYADVFSVSVEELKKFDVHAN